VTGVSMVYPGGAATDEQRYLNDIEALYGTEIRRLPLASFRYLKEEQWLWQIEFPWLFSNPEPASLGAIRELGCSTVLNGYFGDQMMASEAHLFELARSFRWLQLRREFQALAASMTDCPPRILRKEMVHDILRDLAPDWLMRPVRSIRWLRNSDRSPRWYARSLRKIAYQRSQQQRRPDRPFASKQAENCYWYFTFTHRLNLIETANKTAAGYGIEQAYPFMDRDLVEFMMAIPGAVVNWQGVYKGLFREAMCGILPEPIRQRNWKADFTPLVNEAATACAGDLREYLRPDSQAITLGYLDRDFQHAFSRHQAKLTGERALPASQVNAVIALVLWLQVFFTEGAAARQKMQYDNHDASHDLGSDAASPRTSKLRSSGDGEAYQD
jgi:asparagine synthase